MTRPSQSRLIAASTAAVLLAPVFSVPLTAQIAPPPRGVLTASPTGIVFDGVGHPVRPHYAKGGITPSLENLAFGDYVVDHSLEALFENFMDDEGDAIAYLVEIDAISTGNDLLPITIDGEVDLPTTPSGEPDAWAMLSYSVTRESVGVTESWTRFMSTRDEGPGAEIFGYYFVKSALPAGFAARNTLEHSVVELVNNPGAGLEIQALDSHAPWIALLHPLGLPGIVQVLDRVYFSVTKESVQRLDDEGFFPPGAVPSGATVLYVERNSIGKWDGPILWKNPVDLGLDPEEDVDALGITGSQHTIYSTVRDPLFPRCQLEVRIGTTAKKLMDDGVPVVNRIILGAEDDIDGVCAVDPEITNHNSLFGTPHEAVSPWTIDLSVNKIVNANNYEMTFCVSGWDSFAVGRESIYIWAIDPLTGAPVQLLTAPIVDRHVMELTLTFPTTFVSSGSVGTFVASVGNYVHAPLFENSYLSKIVF